MVSLVTSHTNATSKRWHLWEIDLRFTLNSTPGRLHLDELGQGAVDEVLEGPGVRHEQGAELLKS